MKKSVGALLLAGVVLLYGCQSRGSIVSPHTEETYISVDPCTDESRTVAQTAEQTKQADYLTTPEQYAEILSGIWQEKWNEIQTRDMSLPQVNVFSGMLAEDDYLTVVVYSSYVKNMAVVYRLFGGEVIELGDDVQAGFQLELLRDGGSAYLHTTTPFVGNAAEVTEISDMYYSVLEDKLQLDLNVSRTESGGDATSYSRYAGAESYEQITAEEYISLIQNYAFFDELNMLRLDRDGDYKNDSYILFEEQPEELTAAIADSLRIAREI